VNSFKYLRIFFDDKSLTYNIISLQFLFIFSSILELTGISLIGPLFYVLSAGPDSLDNLYLDYFYTFLELKSFNSFVLYFSFTTITVILLGGLFSALSIILLTRVATYGGVYLGNRLFDHYLKMDWVFYLSNKKSMMINEIYQETSRVTQNVLIPALMLNKAAYLTAFILTMLMIVDWKLTIGLFIGLSSVYILIYIFFRKNLNKNSRDLTEAHESRFRFLDDTFSSIKEIHIWVNSKIFLRGFDTASKKWSKALRNNMNISNLPRYIVETFVLILLCLAFLLVFFTSKDITSSLPSYSVFLFSSLKLLPAIQQIYYAGSMIAGNSYSAANLYSILNDTNKKVINLSKFEEDVSSFALKDINYTHIDSGFSLKHINIKMEKGSILGITGFSGSGKSTLVDLMMGLLNPQTGTIEVNQVDKDIYESLEWFNKIAYLPQKITTTNDLLADNIHFQDTDDIDFIKFTDVSKKSNLNEFLDDVNEQNYRNLELGILSGGQLQRVGIARTLYKESDIIFFDEPTSALDNINKNYFLRQIQEIKKNKIIVIVTHDVELLEEVDELVVLNNGTLEFVGSFDDSLVKSETMIGLISADD